MYRDNSDRPTATRGSTSHQPYLHVANPAPKPLGHSYRPVRVSEADDYDPEPRCCWGFLPLKKGAIAIGIVQILAHAIIMAAGLFLLHTNGKDQHLHLDATLRKEAYIGAAILFITHVVFNIILIHGARKGSRRLVLTWLCYHGFVTALLSVAVVVGIIEAAANKQATAIVVNVVVVSMIVLVPGWYFFREGLKLYKRLTQRKMTVRSVEGVVAVPLIR